MIMIMRQCRCPTSSEPALLGDVLLPLGRANTSAAEPQRRYSGGGGRHQRSTNDLHTEAVESQRKVVKIESILLSSGDPIVVTDGLTVLVGPNNAGKSQILREIHERLTGAAQSPNYHPKTTQDVVYREKCNAEELIVWLRSRYRERSAGNYNYGAQNEPHFTYPYGGNSAVTLSAIRSYWGSHQPHLQVLAPFLLRYMSAGDQASSVSSSSSFHVGREVPSNPAQMLFSDRDLERAVSEEMYRAFGEALVVHRYAGSQISIHVGKVSAEETPMPATIEYLQEIEALPLLHEQGDGVRSYMGAVITLATASYPIILLDEPEAFLHPPQAFMLGQFLARQHDRGTQVVVATHSDEILRGIVSTKAAAAAVTVVRVTRSSAGNHAAQVPVEDVQGLYEDPLIKYYGILDGLFFHGVLLCEADSDCTYYRAVLESTVDTLDSGHPVSALSVHFAQCGGKSRVANAVRALRAARVPVACALDIDFLRDNKEFDQLVTDCGGDPASFGRDRTVVIAAVQSRTERLDKELVRLKTNEIIDARRDGNLTSGDANKIKELLDAPSGWKIFKQAGSALLSGDAAVAYNSLDARLRELGIFLVPVGELERFHREVPGRVKAEWLRKVLEQKEYLRAPAATQFVSDIANWIWSHQNQAARAEGKLV